MSKNVLLIIFTYILVILCVLFFIFSKSNITIFLIGNEIEKVNINDEYIDKGIIVKLSDKELGKDKYLLSVRSNIDISNFGIYEVNYEIEYKNKKYNIKRNVEVTDLIPPVLDVNSDVIVKDYCTKINKEEVKYTAFDNIDGDITDKVIIKEKDNKIIYSVTDSKGNTTNKEINIEYSDYINNKIILNGYSEVSVALNGEYIEQGATYVDGCGNKLSNNVNISGSVDTSKIGEYKITYSVNEISINRTVIVYDSKERSKKIIYLTFDDGPGAYTKKLLDILDKYNVKATFFVTNQFSKYISLIKDEYDRGHSIGVHSYTHKWSIYKSVDDYINDFDKMNNVIKKYTGSTSSIFRFPGGSSNTISKNYSKGIVTLIANKMTKNGYAYFDWNVDSKDASGASAEQLYKNILKGIKKCNNCVILMHDIKQKTVNEMDNILKELTNAGYTFKTLNVDSPKIRHSINN